MKKIPTIPGCELFEVDTVAVTLRTSGAKVRELARKGDLPAIMIANRYRFLATDVKKYIANCRTYKFDDEEED